MIIYTDGSCKGNQFKENIGGWAYMAYDDEMNLIQSNHGHVYNTTNSRMEMLAIYYALLETSGNRIIYTDSDFIYKTISLKWYNRWKRSNWRNSANKSIKNVDLWKLIIELLDDVEIKKVIGHSGNIYNEAVDQLSCQLD